MDMNSTSTPSHQMQGGVVVMVDMILGLLSVVTNIVVITAIRRETTERAESEVRSLRRTVRELEERIARMEEKMISN